MPLDLSAISSQVSRMSRQLVSVDRRSLVEVALRELKTQDVRDLRAKLEAPAFRTSWLVARPLASLADTFAPPGRPRSFSVVAADGSFVPPDRHNPLRYYVINTGTVSLTYGARPDARLGTRSELYYEEDDLYVAHDYKQVPVEGALLGVKMAVAELRALFEAAQKARASGGPLIALCDGSLIFWALQAQEDEVRGLFLAELVALFEEFRTEAIPLASYVSYPSSRDVVNALRVGICPDDPVSCDHCTARQARQEPACQRLGQVIDRWLFEPWLARGHRSDVFESSSPVLRDYGDENRIGFFYLNVGTEVARIEAPRWVLDDDGHLPLLHALIYDQCERERGYPPALKEAHEQAVISYAERRVVEDLIRQSLPDRYAVDLGSAKSAHKRERAI